MKNLIENGIIQSVEIERRLDKIATYKWRGQGLHWNKMIKQLSKESRENGMGYPHQLINNMGRMLEIKTNAHFSK